MLSVYIDFKSPACYLALEPTVAFVDRLGLNVRWLAFRTSERDIPGEGVDQRLAQAHDRARRAAERRTHTLYAGLRGIELVFPATAGSTDLALGVLCELDGDPVSFIREAFAAYWTHHLDLDDESVVGELLRRSGVSYPGPLQSARLALRGALREAEAIGVVDAPAYRIAEQLFIGRQHFPWIEEIVRDASAKDT